MKNKKDRRETTGNMRRREYSTVDFEEWVDWALQIGEYSSKDKSKKKKKKMFLDT